MVDIKKITEYKEKRMEGGIMETAGKKIRVAMYCRMGTDMDSKRGWKMQKGWRIPQSNPPAGYPKIEPVFECRHII